ncbi:MAG: methyltransferase family protein [Actinomycetota bacterium]
MLARTTPAFVEIWWLWPIFGAILVAAGYTDRRVRWEQRPGFDWKDAILSVAIVAATVVALALDATLPAGASVAWPLVFFGVMLAALGLRIVSTGLLGDDFNGDLRTRPGQLVVDRGPYRWVRHPGYLGVALFFVGFAGVMAYWPPMLTAAVVIAIYLRQRITKERRSTSPASLATTTTAAGCDGG